MVMGRKRMSLERKVKEIAFAREGGRRVGRIGFEGSKGRLMSDRDLKEKKRTEVCWRSERREGKGARGNEASERGDWKG